MVKMTEENKVTGEVRYIDDSGESKIVKMETLKKLADDAGLDIVIFSEGETPVVKVFDYGKYIYQKKNKKKQGRHKTYSSKEIKFRVNTGKNDYNVKVNHINKFLSKGHKVKISIQVRGREMAHRELGRELLERVAEDTKEVGQLETQIQFYGTQFFAMLSPKSLK